MRILNRIQNHNCIFYWQSSVLTMKLFTCETTSHSPLRSPSLLKFLLFVAVSSVDCIALSLHLVHIDMLALKNAPKLSSRERKRETERDEERKGRKRISRTIFSSRTHSCPPVIGVLSLGASKVLLKWDDCWGKER